MRLSDRHIVRMLIARETEPSELHIVSGAGHEVNKSAPEAIAALHNAIQIHRFLLPCIILLFELDCSHTDVRRKAPHHKNSASSQCRQRCSLIL